MKDILLGAIRGVSEDQIFDACGTAGGLMLAAALLPQIYHVAKRRRARDVSYAYQVRRKSSRRICCPTPLPSGFPSRGRVLVHAALAFGCHETRLQLSAVCRGSRSGRAVLADLASPKSAPPTRNSAPPLNKRVRQLLPQTTLAAACTATPPPKEAPPFSKSGLVPQQKSGRWSAYFSEGSNGS